MAMHDFSWLVTAAFARAALLLLVCWSRFKYTLSPLVIVGRARLIDALNLYRAGRGLSSGRRT